MPDYKAMWSMLKRIQLSFVGLATIDSMDDMDVNEFANYYYAQCCLQDMRRIEHIYGAEE